MTSCPDFTVMTMNLRFGLARDGKNSWPHRKDVMAHFLARHPIDFMGVQEANHFQMGFLQRQLKTHSFIGWHNPALQWWQSNSIFFPSGRRCLTHQHYFLSHTPKVQSKLPGSRWPRQCVMGLFELQGRQLIMANTHFDFDESVQEESARLVLSFLNDFPADTPVVITGDFNAAPGSAAYRVFRSQGFSEVFEDHYTTTFHGFKGQDTRRHIDWILHRGPFRTCCRKVLTTTWKGRYPSDHYPVVAGFTWDSPVSSLKDKGGV